MDIAEWLRSLGLRRYEQAFRDNEIDTEVLATLTADDLKDLGVALVGHRRKMLDAIAALGPGDGFSEGAATPAFPSSVEAEWGGPDSSGAERRQLTVMFCDLVGSTALSTQLDPEDLREVIGAYHRRATEVVAAFGGFVAKYMGDGILVYFGYPRAQENDPERAVSAALQLVLAVKATRPRPSIELSVRVGVATGLAVVGDLIGSGAAKEQAVVGETPNLAARLQGLAGPNSVVVAQSTRRLVGDLFEYREFGPVDLKGFAAPVRAFEVVGPRAVESRFEALHAARLTPVIGREEQIELLERRWQQASKGEGCAVMITGEAGIGKSRLVAAIQDRLRGETPTRMSYQCIAHLRNSPLHPFIAQLERAAGFDRDDTERSKLSKLEKFLAGTSTTAEDVALLTELLSLSGASSRQLDDASPQRRKEMTFEALVRRLERLALTSPVLMVFEDAHWMDPTSKELLDAMVDRLPSLPVLLIVTCRPDIALSWAGQAQVTLLQLNRLDRRGAVELIGHVAGGKELPAEVSEQVISRAQGVPLFVEEMTRALLDSGLLRDEGDRYVLSAPLPPIAVPTTLQAALMARLDRLGSVKDVAQIGAALGREFSDDLIRAVAPQSAAALDDALDRLVASGLVYTRGAPPRMSYVFKHALVQDAAYEMMLKGRRQQLHARIAEALERSHPEIAVQQPELLAHHLAEAGSTARAVELWAAAGDRALARAATREASRFFERALAALGGLERTPEILAGTLDLHRKLYMALHRFGEMHRARANLAEAERLATRLNDPSRHCRILFDMTYILAAMGDATGAIEAGKRALALAARSDDLDSRTGGRLMLARALYAKGRYHESIDHIRAVIAILGEDVPRGQLGPGWLNQTVSARIWLAVCYAELGDFGESAASAAVALRLSAQLDGKHEDESLWLRIAIGRLAVLQRDFAKAVETLEPALPRCEAELAVYFSRIASSLGIAHARLGDVDKGLALLRQAASRAQKMGFLYLSGLVLAQLGEAYLLAGDTGNAQEAAVRALEAARSSGEEGSEAWALWILGEVAARLDPPEAAVRYREALDIADRLEMAPLRGRCLESMSQLG